MPDTVIKTAQMHTLKLLL